MSGHVLITGTGRAGTTFLMEVLTRLGLDTGFTVEQLSEVHPISHGGLEHNLLQPNLPYILKSSLFHNVTTRVFAKPEFQLAHAIIPVRPLEEVAASRARVSKEAIAQGDRGRAIPGGFWEAFSDKEQRVASAAAFHNIVYELTARDVPITFLLFPRLVKDADYLVAKLGPIFPEVSESRFREAFAASSRPERIHKFDAPS